ncbi:MAG: hypothetical protein LC769_00800 [Chloroflexi bacterium]|nr:hypothetical protein [Chloroflexota bacterium]
MAVEQYKGAPPVVSNPREEAALARLKHILDSADSGLYLGTPTGESCPIPASMRHILRLAADMLTHDRAVALEPVHAVSAAQAAAFLRVSQEHFDTLLDKGDLPFRYVGEDRCVKVDDLYAYDERRHHISRRLLREMTRIAEESPGGYD